MMTVSYRSCRTGYNTLAVIPSGVGKSRKEDWEAVDGNCGEADVKGSFAGEADDGNGSGGEEWAYHTTLCGVARSRRTMLIKYYVIH